MTEQLYFKNLLLPATLLVHNLELLIDFNI